MSIYVARVTRNYAALLSASLVAFCILHQTFMLGSIQCGKLDYKLSTHHQASFEAPNARAFVETSAIQLWSEGSFTFVETAKHRHSYPFVASQPVNITVLPLLKASSSVRRSNRRSPSLTVRVVYYVNTKRNPNYHTWIRNQFLDVAPVDEVYIVADALSCAKERKLHSALAWLKNYRNESVIHLECHDLPDETFEYHGIHKIWELGQKYPGRNDIGIYFHSKGVTKAKDYDRYRHYHAHARLTKTVFGESGMNRVLEAFGLFPNVEMAGQDCSQGNWVWYNFFYVRGSYLNTVEQPILTKRRHYYEDWLFRSGAEPQETAPNAPERPSQSYPAHQPYSCYALSGDHASAANLGYYFKRGKRQLLETDPLY